MRFLPALILLTTTGCGDSAGRSEEARSLVESTFAQTVKPGPFGTEALGKGVWYRAPAIDGGCLQNKNWGHVDDPMHSRNADSAGVRRVSPLYGAQRFWTATTDKGWCIYLGDDLSMEITEVNRAADAYVVDYTLNMGRPDGWWECVGAKDKDGYVRVLEQDDGSLQIESDITLGQGACPSNMEVNLNIDRKGGARPSSKAGKAPSKADAVAAFKRLDDALFERDYKAALAATSCYNLFEKKKFGSCSGAEFLNLGPMTRGNPRLGDGPPWTMNALNSLDDIGPPEKDKDDPTLFHVQMKAAKGKAKRRTAAIQWVDNEWRAVAVLSSMAEGLATVQVLYDLDRKDRRDIFERRMDGEAILEDGTPADAAVRYGYVEPDEE